jgi:hypothetical protein
LELHSTFRKMKCFERREEKKGDDTDEHWWCKLCKKRAASVVDSFAPLQKHVDTVQHRACVVADRSGDRRRTVVDMFKGRESE